MIKVCKFGGTSLASREQIEKSLDIMLSDSSRKYMVVSAPGARSKGDIKMTDLLINAAQGDISSFEETKSRINSILSDMPFIADNIVSELDFRRNNYARLGDKMDVYKAFGEFASAKIISAILNKKGIKSNFLCPKELGFTIQNSECNPRPDPSCYSPMGEKLKSFDENIRIGVFPGFYGYTKKEMLATLPRNGTDISGAVLARAVRETGTCDSIIYENFSDEDGLKRANPKIVPYAEVIPEMTYLEARELAYMGFKLQDACFEPLIGKGIILNARNTNNPLHPGTKIVDSRIPLSDERIVGVACENDSHLIGFRKMYSDQEVGLGRKMFSVLEKLSIPYEHSPTGVDTLSLVIRGRYLEGKENINVLAKKIAEKCSAEIVGIQNMSLLSVAGIGMNNYYDTHRRVFSALEKVNARIRMIDDGAEDISLFLGIDRDKADSTVMAIYDEFFHPKI
jgi:aspartate kinase